MIFFCIHQLVIPHLFFLKGTLVGNTFLVRIEELSGFPVSGLTKIHTCSAHVKSHLSGN